MRNSDLTNTYVAFKAPLCSTDLLNLNGTTRITFAERTVQQYKADGMNEEKKEKKKVHFLGLHVRPQSEAKVHSCSLLMFRV